MIGTISVCWCLQKIKATPSSDVFIQICVLLLISQVDYPFASGLEFRITQLYNQNKLGIQIQVDNYISWLLLSFIYWSTYCLAHWIFAARYWLITYQLHQGKRIDIFIKLYYIIGALNVAACAYNSIAGAWDLKKFNLSFQFVIYC